MTLRKQIEQAFLLLVNQAGGNLRQLAQEKKITYCIIHRLKNGQSSFDNMSVGTLEKLFPDIRVCLFRTDKFSDNLKAEREQLLAKEAELKDKEEKLAQERIALYLEKRVFALEQENFRLKQQLEPSKNDVDFSKRLNGVTSSVK